MKEIFRKFILLIQGKLPDYDEFLRVSLELHQQKEGAMDLLSELRVLQAKNKREAIRVPGFDDMSHEPTDEKQRKEYAARVTEFNTDILKPKIKTSIAEVRELLSSVGYISGMPPNMSREQYDFFLRGMEAMGWKIHDWAATLEAELRGKDEDGI